MQENTVAKKPLAIGVGKVCGDNSFMAIPRDEYWWLAICIWNNGIERVIILSRIGEIGDRLLF